MNSVERLRDIRAYEFFVFGGVPEVPEPMYERDSHGYSETRPTGKGLETSPLRMSRRRAQLRSKLVIDIAARKILVVESKEPNSGDHSVFMPRKQTVQKATPDS